MKPIIVAAAVLNQTPLDWRGNLANIHQAINAAREQAVSWDWYRRNRSRKV